MQRYYPSSIIINSTEAFVNEEQISRSKHLARAMLCNTNKKLIFISSTERDLKNMRIHVKTLLEKQGYEVIMFESPDFPQMPVDKQGRAATHDHCIDVALTCKYLIYIYDGTFGGPYSGTDYMKYVNDHPVIKIKPSVSFVEYLVSKHYYKDVRVYVSNAVDVARGEYLMNSSPEKYKSRAVDKREVLEQLGYFNALGNGTWYQKYTTVEDLDKFLLAAFPQDNESDM